MSNRSDMTFPRLAVFLSGGGRTLLNIDDQIKAGELQAQIPLVVASRACAGADRAAARGLHTVILPRVFGEPELLTLLNAHQIDLVVLAGFLRLMPVPEAFEGRIINIHPSLLPRHGGPGMYGHFVHEAVLKSGDTESGCTVHLCTQEYDKGRILVQRRCPVKPDDTPQTLADRVFEQELLAMPEAIKLRLAELQLGPTPIAH
ncbi:MAG: formyltransferase family protein [Planctomycetota bacterium]|nr:formyltransferase family protein [Planctomycetota bacterium]